jgi:hypothetical protein
VIHRGILNRLCVYGIVRLAPNAHDEAVLDWACLSLESEFDFDRGDLKMGRWESFRVSARPDGILGKRVALVILGAVTIFCIGMAARFGDSTYVAQAGFWGGLAWIHYLAIQPDRIYLELSRDGFTERRLFFTLTRAWNDVACFRAVKNDGADIVVFEYAHGYKASFWAEALLRTNGWSGTLLGTYGMSAEKLAELLDAWRSRPSHKH